MPPEVTEQPKAPAAEAQAPADVERMPDPTKFSGEQATNSGSAAYLKDTPLEIVGETKTGGQGSGGLTGSKSGDGAGGLPVSKETARGSAGGESALLGDGSEKTRAKTEGDSSAPGKTLSAVDKTKIGDAVREVAPKMDATDRAKVAEVVEGVAAGKTDALKSASPYEANKEGSLNREQFKALKNSLNKLGVPAESYSLSGRDGAATTTLRVGAPGAQIGARYRTDSGLISGVKETTATMLPDSNYRVVADKVKAGLDKRR